MAFSRKARDAKTGLFRRWTNAVSFFLFCTVFSLAPLPIGSVDPIFSALWCLLLAAALALADPRQMSRIQARLLILPGGLAAALLVVVLLQAKLTEAAFVDPLWDRAAAALGAPLPAGASLVRHQPWLALGPALAALLAAACGIILCSHRSAAQRVIRFYGWVGAAYAVVALLVFVFDPQWVVWREKYEHLSDLTGTFSNRNTTAVFFGTVGVVWALECCRRLAPPGGETGFAEDAEGLGGLIVPGAALLLCLDAIFLTASRSGIVLSVACIVLGPLLFLRKRVGAGSRKMVLTAILGIVLFGALLSGSVALRFQHDGFFDAARVETYRSTLRMVADHPWLGTGWGTFPFAYPAYRSAQVTMWGVWDRAHDSLLEIAAEAGIPFAGIVVAGWIAAMSILAVGIRRRYDPTASTIAFCACLLVSLHSLIDFSLQIPGVAIPVFALAGTGLAQSISSRLR